MQKNALGYRSGMRLLCRYRPHRSLTFKMLLVMKLTLVFLTAAFLHVHATGITQHVTLAAKQLPLKDVFTAIEKQTGFVVFYNESDLKGTSPVSLQANHLLLPDFLNLVLRNQPLGFNIEDKTIMLYRKHASSLPQALPAALQPVQIPVTGTVLGAGGMPLAGAGVKIKGSAAGVAADENGRFAIEADEKAVLLISYVGYAEQEVAVNGRASLQIVLRQQNNALDETVVIGYGTQNRRYVTGAISKVSNIKAEENITSNVFSALQGRVAGLMVKNSEGTAGAMPTFSIRGVQTTNVLSANPLIVVDGMIVDAGQSANASNNQNFNLSNINPQDIESVEVLKDASSAAIYGARGAQGVILITTKKGKFNSKPVVNINTYYGLTSSTVGYRALNVAEYEEVFKEARNNRIKDIELAIAGGGLTPAQITQLQNERQLVNNEINSLTMGTPAGMADNNWLNKVTPGHAVTSNVQASVAGGNQQTSYYVSFGKYAEENAVGTGKYTRYSGKLALTQKVNDWLKLVADINISKTQRANFSYPLAVALAARPDTPDSIRLNADGSYGWWFGRQNHPYGETNAASNAEDVWNYMGNFQAEIALTHDLSFRSTLSGVQNQSSLINFYSPISYNGAGFKGMNSNSGNSGLQYTFNNTFTYKLHVSKLAGDVLLGQEYYDNKKTTTAFSLTGFPVSSGLWSPGNASAYSNADIAGNRVYEENGESYFMRTNLSWDRKYLLNASLRRDASSKLPVNNRHSWFPALSAGWIVSDEAFLSSFKPLSLLKLKAGYGVTGNIRPLGYFDFANLATVNTYLGQPALSLSTVMGNPDLRWERTKQFDIGVETRWLKDQLLLSLEFYHKKTDGLITTLPLPYSTGGFTTQKVNIGTVLNKGVDIDLSYASKVRTSGGFQWNAGVVLNINQNKLLALRDSVLTYGLYYGGGPISYVKRGESIGSLLLYRSLGVDPNTGDMVYNDRNHDGIINQQDQEYITMAQPKLTGGIHGGASFKGFSLQAQMAFSIGSKIYNMADQLNRTFNIDGYGIMSNKIEWVNDRWRQPGDNSYYPRAVVGAHGAGKTTDWNTRPSTHYLFSGSYLRCTNLTAGYTLPAALLKTIQVNGVRIYASVQNLFIIKDKRLKSSDPEVGLQTGIQYNTVPVPRTIAFGIDISL